MALYSEGRQKAVRGIAHELQEHTGLDRGLDFLFLADRALDGALNSGAVMLTENHRRQMREMAKELTADA